MVPQPPSAGGLLRNAAGASSVAIEDLGGTSNRGAAAPLCWPFQGGESREGGNRNPPSLGCLWFLSAQAERNAPGRVDNTANRNHFCSEENHSAAISDGERPPAGPFLNDQKGAKESVKEGDFDFPLLDNPPLETTKHRGDCGPPYWKYPPKLFYSNVCQRRRLTLSRRRCR